MPAIDASVQYLSCSTDSRFHACETPHCVASGPSRLACALRLQNLQYLLCPCCRSVTALSSYQLSEQLLADKAAGALPQYGALVFNDSVIADMAQPFAALNGSLTDVNPASWLGLLPLGLPLNPGAAAGSALAGLSRPESRVISDAVRRFRQHPGIVLMHFPKDWVIYHVSYPTPNRGATRGRSFCV